MVIVKPEMTATCTRSKDFFETHEYIVTLGQHTATIYRDTENGCWCKLVSGMHFSECFIGFTKSEAVAKVAGRMEAF
jgi:hypothetical protein